MRVFDDFLLTLFGKYAELLKKRFSDDFQEVGLPLLNQSISKADTARLYQRMITCPCPYRPKRSTTRSSMLAGTAPSNLARNKCKLWIGLDKIGPYPALTDHCRFPCILPFSRMYPLCCIDIRNFLNQFYFFANDGFANTNVIDETLKNVSSNRHSWHPSLEN